MADGSLADLNYLLRAAVLACCLVRIDYGSAMSQHEPRTKIAVILGAGASTDAASPGGPPADAQWRPPLAKDLFRFDAHPNYWQVAAGYRGVRVLSPELAEVLAAGSASLEEKLAEFAVHPDQRIRGAFRQVPPYLRDLILSVTAS